MKVMNYEELRQKMMREENILKSLEKANECEGCCKFTEEQILEAQKENGKKQINTVYQEVIHPITNSILYMLYNLSTLIILPILYVYDTDGAIIVAVFAYLLLFISYLVLKTVENNVKRDLDKARPWSAYINKFSIDTYMFSYLLTSFGYLLAFVKKFIFWYVYICICICFGIVIYFDILKPVLRWIKSMAKRTNTQKSN